MERSQVVARCQLESEQTKRCSSANLADANFQYCAAGLIGQQWAFNINQYKRLALVLFGS